MSCGFGERMERIPQWLFNQFWMDETPFALHSGCQHAQHSHEVGSSLIHDEGTVSLYLTVWCDFKTPFFLYQLFLIKRVNPYLTEKRGMKTIEWVSHFYVNIYFPHSRKEVCCLQQALCRAYASSSQTFALCIFNEDRGEDKSRL